MFLTGRTEIHSLLMGLVFLEKEVMVSLSSWHHLCPPQYLDITGILMPAMNFLLFCRGSIQNLLTEIGTVLTAQCASLAN